VTIGGVVGGHTQFPDHGQVFDDGIRTHPILQFRPAAEATTAGCCSHVQAGVGGRGWERWERADRAPPRQGTMLEMVHRALAAAACLSRAHTPVTCTHTLPHSQLTHSLLAHTAAADTGGQRNYKKKYFGVDAKEKVAAQTFLSTLLECTRIACV
jgi:hypothetical protein